MEKNYQVFAKAEEILELYTVLQLYCCLDLTRSSVNTQLTKGVLT
jgi:hypothetical protein